jgi:hypothetical protein
MLEPVVVTRRRSQRPWLASRTLRECTARGDNFWMFLRLQIPLTLPHAGGRAENGPPRPCACDFPVRGEQEARDFRAGG